MDALFSKIEAFDTITIFRHIAADADALGAQFGLKTWIQETYPNKKVFALGNDTGPKANLFPPIDVARDDQIQHSLAIILDTANAARIDDSRWKSAAYKIKIDHHIFVDAYADEEYIEDRKGATCEILADMFQKKGLCLSKTCAEYLYGGLIADTLQFSIQATTPEMLRCGAYLVEQGVDVAKVNEQNFSKSWKEFEFETYIRTHYTLLDECIAYIIVHPSDYERYDLTLNQAKEKVYALSKVHEFQAWALFIETGQEQGESVYNGSLRSKNIEINDIAMSYNGGGHRFACGVKGLKEKDIQSLLQDLSKRMRKEKS